MRASCTRRSACPPPRMRRIWQSAAEASRSVAAREARRSARAGWRRRGRPAHVGHAADQSALNEMQAMGGAQPAKEVRALHGPRPQRPGRRPAGRWRSRTRPRYRAEGGRRTWSSRAAGRQALLPARRLRARAQAARGIRRPERSNADLRHRAGACWAGCGCCAAWPTRSWASADARQRVPAVRGAVEAADACSRSCRRPQAGLAQRARRGWADDELTD